MTLPLIPLVLVVTAVTASAQAPDGAALYAARCAACHSTTGDSRAPSIDALKERSPEAIIDAGTSTAPLDSPTGRR